MFKAALVTVWGDAGNAVAFEVVNDPPPAGGVLASLRYDSYEARAYKRELLQCANHHTLCVAPELLMRDHEVVQKFLLHEAIHVGHPRHDKVFDDVAAEVGTASTARGIEGAGFVVEVQGGKGERFKKAFSTTNRIEATTFAKEKRAGEGRYRIVY